MDTTKKKCLRCGRAKSLDDFRWVPAKGRREALCRDCLRRYQREHYLNNRAKYRSRATANRARTREERLRWLAQYFAEHPCADCGQTDPVVLEFDHIADKSFTIGSMLEGVSTRRLLQEIAKCEVVCVNCHRRRTARRQGSIRYRLTTRPRQRMLFF